MTRNDNIRSLYIKGIGRSQIAKMFGISRQRVFQIVKDPENDWQKNKEKYKKYIFFRDCYQCQWGHKCIRKKNEKNLIVHHIDGNQNNNKFSNLMTLCIKCHTSFHMITLKNKGKNNIINKKINNISIPVLKDYQIALEKRQKAKIQREADRLQNIENRYVSDSEIVRKAIDQYKS